MNSCISSRTFCCALRPYLRPELRRPRALREELRRDLDEVLERREDEAFVRRCPVLLRRPVADRPRDFERVDRERDDDELFLRECDVDLRVAIVSSLLHIQTTAHSHGLRTSRIRLEDENVEGRMKTSDVRYEEIKFSRIEERVDGMSAFYTVATAVATATASIGS
ncbi:MAG TPA: hypothetical protein VFU86_23990 [Terriglobales bacterium]|nr:hypothetical protein [Terriglobales bacterium]